MLSHFGPKYDDLVNIYCHAHWGSPHPSFRREDIWEAGTLQPMEHPEMLYLPPNLPGSKSITRIPHFHFLLPYQLETDWVNILIADTEVRNNLVRF